MIHIGIIEDDRGINNIDEFCVDYNMQKKGIGSMFLKKIEEQIKGIGMNGLVVLGK